MASRLIRSTFLPLVAVAFTTVAAEAQQSFTDPSGYVQVTVAANTLGVLSATLTNKSEFTGNVTINNDWDAGSAGPPPVPPSQTISVSPDPGWAVNQWASAATPHVIYVVDSNGAEETFLITANTSDTLTITTRYDLLLRISPATTSGSIRLAQTLATIYGTPADSPLTSGTSSSGDAVYVWTGTSWQRFYINSTRTQWRSTGFGDKSNTVIFSDEGTFVQNTQGSDVTFTLFGDPAVRDRISTVEGAGLYFDSMQFPVPVTIGTLGYQNLPDWVNGTSSSGDALYVWNPGPPGSWTRYYWNGTQWRSTGFGAKDNVVVPPDSAVFVQREAANPVGTSQVIHVKPYIP